jgi:hypothetical protein
MAQPDFLRQTTERSTALSTQGNAATAGITMGSALAMILSFQLNHSVLWAIVHGICSWFYVIYRVFKGNY